VTGPGAAGPGPDLGSGPELEPGAEPRGDRLAVVRARPAPLFVYGTLLFDEIARALLGRVPSRGRATVPGWRVAPLIGVGYPALVPALDAVARGELLTDLSWAERRVLDDYEGDQYRLALLTAASGRLVWSYVRGPAARPAAEGTWRRDDFARHELAAFLGRLTD
jgi:gamma-glutamylcyclotransferase (GGCT)/AIG2-like uncharacterized protein YtfP